MINTILPKTCDVCGKEREVMWFSLHYYNGIRGVAGKEADSAKIDSQLKDSFGPYEPEKVYNICCACGLRAFGVKPPKKKGG